MAGDWRQHEVYDGTYNIVDLLDWYEMQTVKNENQRRYEAARKWLSSTP
jgi:hypothetical protein